MLCAFNNHILDTLLLSLTEHEQAILKFYLRWTISRTPKAKDLEPIGLPDTAAYDEAVSRILGSLRTQLVGLGIGSADDIDLHDGSCSTVLMDVELRKKQMKKPAHAKLAELAAA